MKLTDLLDEIDRLELEICPGPWVANDLGIGYEITTQQQMPINSGIKDTFPRSDAEFIALARTALPALSRAVRAVMELHMPETRWIYEPEPDMSFSSKAEVLEWYDLDNEPHDPADVTTFRLCIHCAEIEQGAAEDLGHLTALWPCATVQEIHDAMEDVADGQALDQARAEDDGTRITLDKYLEDDDD